MLPSVRTTGNPTAGCPGVHSTVEVAHVVAGGSQRLRRPAGPLTTAAHRDDQTVVRHRRRAEQTQRPVHGIGRVPAVLLVVLPDVQQQHLSAVGQAGGLSSVTLARLSSHGWTRPVTSTKLRTPSTAAPSTVTSPSPRRALTTSRSLQQKGPPGPTRSTKIQANPLRRTRPARLRRRAWPRRGLLRGGRRACAARLPTPRPPGRCGSGRAGCAAGGRT